MKKIVLIALCAVAAPAFAQTYYSQPRSGGYGSSSGYGSDQTVSGYTRSNGTYVEPYHRTAPDANLYNNYSTQGNFNPYTGEAGHRNPGY